MSKTFDLVIRTPEKEVYQGKVQAVKLVTEEGLIKILPNHASLTGTIAYSPIMLTDAHGTEDDYVARRGLLRVSNEEKSVDIMVFDCTPTKELDPMSAREYLKFLEKELAEGVDVSEFKLAYLKEEKLVVEKQLKNTEK